ncbi:MAG: glycosyltransferase family 2 protein [bacterium]|nr:glycosyltransferase family 2 protein [bacterium]
MQQPLVHVLIVNWKGRPHVQECFESLLAGNYPNARFVLLDNASDDGSLEFVQTHYGDRPNVDIVLLGENLGWSRANNVGMDRAMDAGADYVFLLNDDTVTAPDAIARMVEMAEAHPEIGCVAPKMLLYDNPDLLNSMGVTCSVVGAGWDIGLGRLDGPEWNESRPVLGACGGACLFRVDTLRKTGLLPDDFDIYLDDLDLCLRVWSAGYEIRTCPAAEVRHKFSATMGHGSAARRKYFLNTRNRMYLILRNFPWSHMPFVKVCLGLAEARAVGRAVLNREWWKLGVHVRAWIAGAVYVPKSLGMRAEQRRRGLRPARFWAMVQSRPFFFPGVELPQDGWYEERSIRGAMLRPVSRTASLHVDTGRLRVTHANCYPQSGQSDIEVSLDGEPLAVLRTKDLDETVIDVPAPGTLQFKARFVFDAEPSGPDFGGWVRVDRL